MRVFAVTSDAFREWAAEAKDRWRDPKYQRNLADRTSFAKEGEDFNGWEYQLPLVQPFASSAFEHLEDLVFVFDEPALIETTARTLHEQLEARFEAVDSDGDIALEPKHLFLSLDELRERIGGVPRLELRALGRSDAALDEEFGIDGAIERNSRLAFLFASNGNQPAIELRSQVARKYRGDIAALAADLKKDPTTPTFISGPPEWLSALARSSINMT